MKIAKFAAAFPAAILAAAALAGAASARAESLPSAPYIPLAVALEAAQAALAKCVAQPSHVTVTVINEYAVVLVQLHDELSSLHSPYSSEHKAYTALTYGKAGVATTSAGVGERFKDNPGIALNNPGMLLTGGGIAIKSGNRLVGAIGVGGSALRGGDEQCAEAGIEKIKDRL